MVYMIKKKKNTPGGNSFGTEGDYMLAGSDPADDDKRLKSHGPDRKGNKKNCHGHA
jgi:hypothetical protein